MLFISKIQKINKWEYEIFSEGISRPETYGEEVKVEYLEQEAVNRFIVGYKKFSSSQGAMTKKAKNLCIGDRVIFPGVGEITVIQLKATNQEFVIRVGWSTGSDVIRTDTELTILV